MPYDLNDTIVAISSPPGGAAEGIVRLSGPEAARCVGPIVALDETDAELDAVRRPSALTGSIRLPDLASPLPCTLYVWPEGRSYSGQRVVELHTLGSPPLLEAITAACLAAGARAAGPGEFTLRAFLAGRIDLTQAEAVLGVIDADDSAQLDAALAQLAGGLARPLRRLRDELLDLLSHVEAGLDFADEDLAFLEADQLRDGLTGALAEVERLDRQIASRDRTSGLARVVLIGCPNAGKSSLFNALAGLPGALVSELPGTTRDYLRAELDLDGVRVELIDTAGVEHADADESHPDHAAQAVREQQTAAADVRLICLDGGRDLNSWERGQINDTPRADHVVVVTKTDLPESRRCSTSTDEVLPVSVRSGEGLEALRRRLREAVSSVADGSGQVVAATSTRCRESIRQAAESLRRAAELVDRRGGDELVAAELRLALDAIGQVAGTVHADDLLDRVFSRFCIGK